MTGDVARITVLAGDALHSATARDKGAAATALHAIGAEFGGAGIAYAMNTWCDALVEALHQAGIQAKPTSTWVPAWVNPAGEPTRDASQLSPELRWAGQYCAARAARDTAMCDALLSAIPDDQQAIANHTAALLNGIGLTLSHMASDGGSCSWLA